MTPDPTRPPNPARAALRTSALLLALAAPALAAEATPPAALTDPYVPPGDPVDPAAVTALTLDQILIYADAHAPRIAAARARIGLADADIAAADPLLPANPEIEIGAGARIIHGDRGLDLEVGLRQQLAISGARGLALDAARDRRRLAEGAVNETRWQVHVEAHRHFVDLLLAREQRAQAERFVAFSTALRDIAARQVDAGEISPLVLLVADADLARTREAVIDADQRAAALRTRLAALIGWRAPELPPLEGALPAIRPAPDIDALLELMTAHHPTLRARALAIRAGRSHIDAQARAAWPDPTIGLSYTREAGHGPDPPADIWSLSLGLPIPIWRQNPGPRARAAAEARIAEREQAATARRLRAELTEAAAALDAAAARVALYETGVVPRLEENLALLQTAFRLGEADVHQISQTRARLLEATGQHIQARRAWYETAATLEGLVGTEIWHDPGPAP